MLVPCVPLFITLHHRAQSNGANITGKKTKEACVEIYEEQSQDKT